jgi:16S rRNA (adenine1518-N6/adenine1519-N6)-dimethyltransferase
VSRAQPLEQRGPLGALALDRVLVDDEERDGAAARGVARVRDERLEEVARAGRVVAVELDAELAATLPALVGSDRLTVLHDDALEVDPTASFGRAYKLVANLPYQITSPVLRRYLVDVRRPRILVLMVQRELAQRVVSGDGQRSYLSVLVQSIADARIDRIVPPGAFFPRPKVTSAVLVITPRAAPLVEEASLANYLDLVRAGFAQPRKTLVNSLAQGLGRSRAEVEPWLARAGLDWAPRPQQLRVEDWVTLFRAEPG